MLIKLRWNYSIALFMDDRASQDDLVEAATLFQELSRTAQRVYGNSHPTTAEIKLHHRIVQRKLAPFDALS